MDLADSASLYTKCGWSEHPNTVIRIYFAALLHILNVQPIVLGTTGKSVRAVRF